MVLPGNLCSVRPLTVVLACTVLISSSAEAHDVHEHGGAPHHWHLKNDTAHVEGFFHHTRGTVVYIEDEHEVLWALPIDRLSEDDQRYVAQREARIRAINNVHGTYVRSHAADRAISFIEVGVILLLVAGFLFKRSSRRLAIAPFVAAGVLLMGAGGHALRETRSLSDPAVMDSAFAPFKPTVATHWDDDWFYVESLGLAQHEMMAGITSWQQQVPIPQCYIGANAWQIPLNPALADTVIPVDSIHFIRGAVAVAVNGIPIFNPHTNTGVDAYLDGQLDEFGGHSGRADDYHYHIAPLHLYAHTSPTRPIAFGLDGYAVYGDEEPDGSPMMPLDSNHGHFGLDGVYHYHGTAEAPYMIGNMVGQVTEDTTHQLVPQPHAHPVRPALTPLSGAVIISNTPNADTTGFTLIYTRNGAMDSVVYNWTADGVYTFRFYVNGTETTQVYNGPPPCSLSTLVREVEAGGLLVFPSPSEGGFMLRTGIGLRATDVRSIEVFDIQGRPVRSFNGFVPHIDLHDAGTGTYVIRLATRDRMATQKVVLR